VQTHEGAAPERPQFEPWLKSLQARDPELFAELEQHRRELVASPAGRVPEGIVPEAVQEIVAETIVRQGRPALLVNDHRLVAPAEIEPAAVTVMNRLNASRAVLEPMIPLVGRIDVENFPAGNVTYVGTGWLVDAELVVTNRHVAELIARRDGASYAFRPGRAGRKLAVSVDYRHEHGVRAAESVRVERVLWIEPDARKADIAFLKVASTGRVLPEGTPRNIRVASADAAENAHVAVVGYPARAPAHIIPDQAWMDRIYGAAYDVKRVAPGMMGPRSHDSATHDCTTLGGNSGSVVLDMQTGEAVALHFAGLYMVENYAVPASVIRQYLRNRPWHSGRPQRPAGREDTTDTTGAVTVAAPGHSGVSLTIPLVVNISLGALQTRSTSATVHLGTAAGDVSSIDEAALALRRERHPDVVDVWPGYLMRGGQLTDDRCLVVSARPGRLDAVRSAMPRTFAGVAVDVGAASPVEQLREQAGIVGEAVTSIAYNDDDRTGPGFSFDWVEEEMQLLLHVGPERSWPVLQDFLADTRRRLISSMYEFHARHIARALQERLMDGARLRLLLGSQSRDREGDRPDGDFERATTFARWAEQWPNRFDRIFIPAGSRGLVANAYHIKVTVRDDNNGAAVWLSSGNWKRSSQPLIAAADLDDPRVTTRAGNREWHVVVQSPTLAERFRNHLEEDFRHAEELGGTLEAIDADVMIDVPLAALEAIEVEGPAARVLEPLVIHKRPVRLKPLLTPDRQGAVYSRAVLQLIRSARRSLLFQIPYINTRGADAGFLKQLVDALAERSRRIDDFRLLLRTPVNDLRFNMSQLKRRGIDLDRVRLLANTHTKGMVVDDARVLVGSHNWSSAGVTLNRDASLIFDDAEVAKYYREAFELDWDRARDVSFDESVVTESPRPAEGDAPPPGFVRMTLAEFLEEV
jgi:V8-like Glu-specific endopeptidase